MEFYTFLKRPPKVKSPECSEYEDTFQLSFDKYTGSPVLVKTGVINRYSQIQSFKDGCDLHTILSHLDPKQVNGLLNSYSVSDLEKSGILDLTSLPKNPGDMLNLVKKSQSLFDGLPLDFRQEFNFSVDKFISSYGSQEFIDICDKHGIKVHNHKFFKRTTPKTTREKVGATSAALASTSTSSSQPEAGQVQKGSE